MRVLEEMKGRWIKLGLVDEVKEAGDEVQNEAVCTCKYALLKAESSEALKNLWAFETG